MEVRAGAETAGGVEQVAGDPVGTVLGVDLGVHPGDVLVLVGLALPHPVHVAAALRVRELRCVRPHPRFQSEDTFGRRAEYGVVCYLEVPGGADERGRRLAVHSDIISTGHVLAHVIQRRTTTIVEYGDMPAEA